MKRSSRGRRLVPHHRRLFLLSLWLVFVALCGLFTALWNSAPPDLEALRCAEASRAVVDREGRLLRVFATSGGEVRLPIRLSEVSPWLIRATVAVEDRRFFSHRGVDVLAASRAFCQNVSRGRVHSGASTLTMQLVRMLEPRPRTLWAKAVESFRALQVEERLDKVAILEAYLNLAPYGGNVRGVEAASRRYFSKRAADLSLSEAALLAGLPQSPSRLRPDRHYERALERRRVVLDAMLRCGGISAREHAEALAARPQVRLHPWPFAAPHLAELAAGEARGTAVAHTTLDLDAQRAAEVELDAALETVPLARHRLGGAVVVLDVAGGAVRALVGSPDYFDVARRGQVNAALARRSPGSALKPFLYALAFDRGIATPASYLADVPASFAGFDPENFAPRFEGPVEASQALSRSLNLPALRLQQRVGTGSFLELLRACGLGTLDRPGRSYGLTLCLGGGEVCLLDLAAAYATLVRLGEHLPRRVLDDARPAATRRVVSAAAARWVLDALSTPEHLRRLRGRVPQAEGFRWGYKTGTSYGFRDAWAFAFSAERVVGVWIGDPEGRPLPELVGLEAAAPLAFAVLAQLSSRAPADWPQAEGSVEASVCSASGYPLGRFCPAAKLGRRIAGAPELPACSVHHEVLIDRERGVEVCRACKGGRSVERRVVEDWPHEVAAWMRLEAGGAGPPPHDADCRARVAGAAPRILTPAAGEEYLYVPGGPARQRVAFEAAAPSGARRLSWFVDGAFLASAAAGERVPWPLAPGRHEVRCVDDRGRAAAVEFRVERWKPRR